MNDIYSMRIYDTELVKSELVTEQLARGVTKVLHIINESMKSLLPLDMECAGEGVLKWLRKRVIPKNSAFVEEILKTFGLSPNNIKGIIDVCMGLS